MANVKKVKTNTKSRTLKIAGIISGLVLIIYVLALINPLTGNHLQYPYYELFCGRKPVVALSFMGSRTYKTPDMQGYDVGGMYSTLYCTENDARSNGYYKS